MGMSMVNVSSSKAVVIGTYRGGLVVVVIIVTGSEVVGHHHCW